MFLRLVIAVTTGKEVPKWMYNIGQGFQGRIHIDYDDITESAALKTALLFFLRVCFGKYLLHRHYVLHDK